MKDEEINGVGPSWFPKKWRESLTRFSLIFFDDSCWIEHDKAYTKGGFLKDKLTADWIFFKSLLSSTTKRKHKMIIGIPLSVLYYLSVLLFGFPAYNFIYL